MPLPDDIHNEDRNYRIRLCMLVSEANPNWVVPGSKINVCDSCDQPIWVNEGQEIPPLPDGLELHGDLNVCKYCMRTIQEGSTEPEVTWIGAVPPPDVLDAVKRFLGRETPLT